MGSPKNFSADAISNLPANVIDSILARLSLRDAVRTSILSREWRYRWISIPKLVFDFQFDQTLLHNHKLEKIIYQVLLRHQGSINKFALQVPTYRSSPDIDHWILLLSSSKVQDFTLHLFWGYKHEMTSHFFALQHLKHLNLYRCAFKPPPQFKGFSRLITLDFQDVDFVPAVFGRFISQCSLLERVRLVGCTDWNSFEIEGPCLKFFTFHGVFKTIRFKNSPVLAEVSLSTPIFGNRESQSSICIKYFDFLPTLEKLHLHPGVLEVANVVLIMKYVFNMWLALIFLGVFASKFLGAGGVPNRFPNSLNRLRVLDLSMYLDSIKEVACAFCLARSSPNLQKLRVTLYARRTVEAVIEFIRAQETPDCCLNHLTRVEIALFSGVEPQIEFVRYLLASAAALGEMVITPACSALFDDVRLMNRLKQFPRASPSALVTLSSANSPFQRIQI